MRKVRETRAASLLMTVALIVVLGAIATALVTLMQILGGGEQVQRAVDAGNLSLVRSVLTQVNVALPKAGSEIQFNGVSDHSSGPNGVINLRNVNRVMGQSLLVNLNAFQIAQQGLDMGATTHAREITTLSQQLGSNLKTQLQQPNVVDTYFNSIATNNPTTEFATKSVAANSQKLTQLSYVDRSTPSNVYIAPQQVADWNAQTNTSSLYNTKVINWTTTLNPLQASQPARAFLNGYVDGLSPGTSFSNTYFVPLKRGATPHLIAQAEFAQNTSQQSGTSHFSWADPVPNSLSLSATSADRERSSAGFTAYAQVEPIDKVGFSASIPHGFIRLRNGAASPAQGVGAGNSDAFVFAMNDPQFYPTDKNGNPLPYFVGMNDSPLPYNASSGQQYLNSIIQAINSGQAPDCSGLSVGYQLSGDHIGLGGVSQANCSQIAGIGNGGQPVDNIVLDDPTSVPNQQMQTYNNTDARMLYCRPLLETAYNIPQPQPIGSNGQSVNVADMINLDLLSARAKGEDFAATNHQSGIANIPSGTRHALQSPNFKITDDRGALLASTGIGGIRKNGATWNFLTQRMFEIDPNWVSYAHFPDGTANVDVILSQDYIPMGGYAYIYYSQSAYAGKGGIVLKNQTNALADAPWLKDFIGELPDAKSPVNPSELSQFGLPNDQQIDVSGDWGFPHPFDQEGSLSIVNWYSVTPSSGWNNLLGQIDMGACDCAQGASTMSSDFSVNYAGDTLTLPPACSCQNNRKCKYGGPC